MSLVATEREGRLKISELSISYTNLDPTQELIDQSADRLERYAREAAARILGEDFQVIVLVDEGSLRERVSLYVSIAGLAVSVIAADFSIAQKNLTWLYTKASEFSRAIRQRELRDSSLPVKVPEQDRSVVVRRRTTSLDRLQAFLHSAHNVRLDVRSSSRRVQLVESVVGLLRTIPTVDEKRELLGYLEKDKALMTALSAELGGDYVDELLQPRATSTTEASQLLLPGDEGRGQKKPRRRKAKSKLRPARRQFLT